jgi:hypothetical protein
MWPATGLDVMVSSLDPGVGKTTAIRFFIDVLLSGPAYADAGVLLCVARLDEVKNLIESIGIPPDMLAVLTSRPDLAVSSTDANRASMPSADRSTDSSIDRGARTMSVPGAQRAVVRSGGTPEQADQTDRQLGFSARDTSNTSRVSISDGAETKSTSGFARATAGTNVADREGVMSIRSPHGTPRSGNDIRSTDLITVSGYTTTVAAALAMGVVVKDASGTFYNVNADQLAAEEQAKEDHRQEQMPKEEAIQPLSDPEAESLVNHYTSKVHATDSQMAIKALLDNQQPGEDNVRAIATALGVEPQIARQQIETMRAGFEQQAREVATDSVLMWAKENRLDDLKAAARDQINVGSTKGYQKLQAAYVKDLPSINPNAILNSPDGQRLQAQKDRQGNITIVVPGAGRVEWRAAIASGFIAPKMVGK